MIFTNDGKVDYAPTICWLCAVKSKNRIKSKVIRSVLEKSIQKTQQKNSHHELLLVDFSVIRVVCEFSVESEHHRNSGC